MEVVRDERGGATVVRDGHPQSYVDTGDPLLLVFEYVQHLALVLESLRPDPAPLAVTHVGGAGMTLARWVHRTHPGSPQIVLEPDTALTELVRRLVARGDVRMHDVAEPRDARVERRLGLRHPRLRLLHAARERLALLDERAAVLLGGGAHELAVRVLLGAQALELGDRGAARRLRLQRLVDVRDRVAPALLAGLDEVGLLAQQLGIDHPCSLRAAGVVLLRAALGGS